MSYLILMLIGIIFLILTYYLFILSLKYKISEVNWINYLIFIISFVIVLLFLLGTLKKHVIEPLEVSSESMENHLYEKNIVLVNKLAIKVNSIQRNGIYVFKDHHGMLTIKRCIGLPGDTIEIIDGIVYINGVQEIPPNTVKKQYIVEIERGQGFTSFLKEKKIKGEKIAEDKNTGHLKLKLTLTEKEREQLNEFGNNFKIVKQINTEKPKKDYPNLLTENLDRLTKITVPIAGDNMLDKYFFLGDNRDVSVDSRWLGCISADKILGNVEIIIH